MIEIKLVLWAVATLLAFFIGRASMVWQIKRGLNRIIAKREDGRDE